jgi:hypothetical protein
VDDTVDILSSSWRIFVLFRIVSNATNLVATYNICLFEQISMQRGLWCCQNDYVSNANLHGVLINKEKKTPKACMLKVSALALVYSRSY